MDINKIIKNQIQSKIMKKSLFSENSLRIIKIF